MALYNIFYMIAAQYFIPLRVIPVQVYSGCCTRSIFQSGAKTCTINYHVNMVTPLILVGDLSPGRQFSREK